MKKTAIMLLITAFLLSACLPQTNSEAPAHESSPVLSGNDASSEPPADNTISENANSSL